MANISITRALSELKLLDGRINRAISEGKFITTQLGQKLINGHITLKDFEVLAKASIDKVNALVERRNKIKSAIVASNAITVVKFPSGVEYTVAEVIERKSSIVYEKTLLQTLKYQYNQAVTSLERANREAEATLEKRIENILGKDAKKDESKKSEIENITALFNKDNLTTLVDPIGLKVVIDELQEKIEEFENEADFLLSESNTRTDIEVSE
jgi:hypothetical protein